MGEIWLLGLPKFSKFSPAAQKRKESMSLIFQNPQKFFPGLKMNDFWLKDLPKLKKFSPAALKMEEIKICDIFRDKNASVIFQIVVRFS